MAFLNDGLISAKRLTTHKTSAVKGAHRAADDNSS